MELNEALSQITQIRRQMARAGLFRGYRSATVAFSGCVALAGAFVQSAMVPVPYQNLTGYLSVWLAVAVISLLAAAVHMVIRCRRSDSSLQRDLTVLAAEQFAPPLVAGALLTLAIDLFAQPEAWLLPGLWSIMVAMGVFASRTVLPRAIGIVGGFYLLAGLTCISLNPRHAFSPWTMGLIFSIGQFLAAIILYWTLERRTGMTPGEPPNLELMQKPFQPGDNQNLRHKILS